MTRAPRHSFTRILFALALALALTSSATAQTGQVMPAPKFVGLDNDGNPLSGGKLYAYAAGTTTPQNTYTTSALSVANANPVILDSAGRATVYLDPALSYKFTLKTSADVELWTQDNIVGSFTGTISTASTRGLQISRASAEAGLSISSTGGSGKTWGFGSTTTGTLVIQDDSDASPKIQLGTGDNVYVTGLFSGLTFGVNSFDAGGTGAQGLRVRNTTAGTGNYSRLFLGNDAATDTGTVTAFSSTFTTSGPSVADGVTLAGTRAGGVSIDASNAAGDIRFYAGGDTTPAATIYENGEFQVGAMIPTLCSISSGTSHNLNIDGCSAINYYNGIGDANVTGFVAPARDGRIVFISQAPGSTGALILEHEDANSTAANRITSSTGADITMTTTSFVIMTYQNSSSRWVAYKVY